MSCAKGRGEALLLTSPAEPQSTKGFSEGNPERKLLRAKSCKYFQGWSLDPWSWFPESVSCSDCILIHQSRIVHPH